MADGAIAAVVFDVGRVLYQWELRTLFAKLLDDPAQLDVVLSEVVTEGWHFEHDWGVRWPRWCPSARRCSRITRT